MMTGKTYIITGAYGSGKTEFSINFSEFLVKQLENPDERVTLADLDVLNLYFRSREKAKELSEKRIDIAGNALGADFSGDMPALNYAFMANMEKKETVVIDLAGSENGINALSTCYESIKEHEFLCVLNPFRSETSDVDLMIKMIHKLNAVSQIKITGLVNNSNLLHETTAEHVIHGQEQIEKVSEQLDLPIRFTMVDRKIHELVKDELVSDEVLVFDKLMMRKEWQ
jgi:MinD superfamily P-loop ATPase